MRRRKLLVGGSVIVLALSGLILTGIRQSVVYFVTPSELAQAQERGAGKAYRLGGMVVQGSLQQDRGRREHRFVLTDGKTFVPVRFQGLPPDLFGEGRGAVVEHCAAVTAGQNHTCGVTATDTVYCWGDHAIDQFGNGTQLPSYERHWYHKPTRTAATLRS